MSPAKTTDAAVLDALTGLFRDHGFEGVSLTLIAEATGLQRASLYHRFPGGKLEMTRAVLDHVHGLFEAGVLAPLQGEGTPAVKVRKAARVIDEFYEGGQRGCLVDSLSLGAVQAEVRERLAATLAALSEGFARVAREAGLTPAVAKRRAQEALVRLQGSLVLARAVGDTQPFQRFVRELPELLTGAA